MRDNLGINAVGLFQIAHGFSKITHAAWINNGASDTTLPQLIKRHPLNAAAGFHHHQMGVVVAYKRSEPDNALLIVLKPLTMVGRNKTVQPVFRNIDTTHVLHHNNLSCLYD